MYTKMQWIKKRKKRKTVNLPFCPRLKWSCLCNVCPFLCYFLSKPNIVQIIKCGHKINVFPRNLIKKVIYIRNTRKQTCHLGFDILLLLVLVKRAKRTEMCINFPFFMWQDMLSYLVHQSQNCSYKTELCYLKYLTVFQSYNQKYHMYSSMW